MKVETPLIERTIPGITWKQIMALIVIVATVVTMYLRIDTIAVRGLDQSKQNGEVLMEIQKERKEVERVNDIRLNKIELELAETRIRLINLEKQIKN